MIKRQLNSFPRFPNFISHSVLWIFSLQKYRFIGFLLLSIIRPKELFQPYSTTKMDRYPAIFSFIQKHLNGRGDLRILSFGCSTGEEVFTLRSYLPHAEVVGIDINPFNTFVCRWKLRRKHSPLTQFKTAGSTVGERDASYDAIFCMAVFRHGKLGSETVESCEQFIRFSDFSTSLTEICRCLKPGGYLAIRHSNFRFEDVSISSQFDCVLRVDGATTRIHTPIYDSNNTLIEGYTDENVIFFKRLI